jgi:hypothetical protein
MTHCLQMEKLRMYLGKCLRNELFLSLWYLLAVRNICQLVFCERERKAQLTDFTPCFS